jgi:hypothetical protein
MFSLVKKYLRFIILAWLLKWDNICCPLCKERKQKYCGIFAWGMKATRCRCHTTTGKHELSLSKDPLPGFNHKIRDNIKAAARQKIHNVATIRYNNNGSSSRDQLNNCIRQQGKGVFCAIQPEVISQGPAKATSSSVLGQQLEELQLADSHGINAVRSNVTVDLVCEWQWSVKYSHKLCIKGSSELIYQSKPRLQSLYHVTI